VVSFTRKNGEKPVDGGVDGVETDQKPGSSPKRKPPRPLQSINGGDVVPERVKFLWYPYIPAGKLTLLEGDPGMGKSWISCAIAKAVAGGEGLPGQEKLTKLRPQKVLLVSAEDGISDTIVPRLKYMGADVSMIDFVTESFVLDPDGVRALEETMRLFAATIVFIDPLVAYVGAKIDMHRANEVRSVMEGLSRAAEITGCAVVVIRHLRKAGGKNALYSGIGSIDFTAAARSVLVTGWAKDGTTRLLRHIKCNNAAEGATVAYEITKGDCTFVEEEGGGFATSVWESGGFKWLGVVEDEEDESRNRKASTTPKKLDGAKEFLVSLLNQGAVSAMDAVQAARQAGISDVTLNRAKKGLVVSENYGGRWMWRLITQGVNGEDAANGT